MPPSLSAFSSQAPFLSQLAFSFRLLFASEAPALAFHAGVASLHPSALVSQPPPLLELPTAPGSSAAQAAFAFLSTSAFPPLP